MRWGAAHIRGAPARRLATRDRLQTPRYGTGAAARRSEPDSDGGVKPRASFSKEVASYDRDIKALTDMESRRLRHRIRLVLYRERPSKMDSKPEPLEVDESS